jgi:predicted nucleotidyltransferase component of viral defense system
LDLRRLEEIKRLVIIAMFSDDDLMERLVLKGGNALDIIHRMANRASIDLDFSIESEFGKEDLEVIGRKIGKALENTFRPEGYEIFDIRFSEKPRKITPDMADFWGGYLVEFKIIESDKYALLGNDRNALRHHATVVGRNQKRKFMIEISKFEYCQPKEERELEGYTIYVYTLVMIVLEKIRAICQQMPEYSQVVKNPSQSARARDFFDIYTVMESCDIELGSNENIELLRRIFHAKRVPLALLAKIQNYKEYHRPDFEAVVATVKPGTDLKDFDFYFDYVVEKIRALKPLWEE